MLLGYSLWVFLKVFIYFHNHQQVLYGLKESNCCFCPCVTGVWAKLMIDFTRLSCMFYCFTADILGTQKLVTHNNGISAILAVYMSVSSVVKKKNSVS